MFFSFYPHFLDICIPYRQYVYIVVDTHLYLYTLLIDLFPILTQVFA